MNNPGPAILTQLRAVVGAEWLLTDADALARYGVDQTTVYSARPCAVALPADVGQVQALVRCAAEHHLAVVPSGGRTGLSGGAVATHGELVLALDRLDHVEDFNPIDRTVRCGAGVVTQQLQAFAAEQGLFYPVDFASSGSSQLGGNIATNAGGIKVIRYGSTRDWVRGLRVVTAAGELLDLNRGLVKNNAGFDLRHLIIGSEGTLGVVVEATMRLARPPTDLAVLLLGAQDMEALLVILQAFREPIPLTACEFFSDRALARVLERHALARPLDAEAPCYALLEFERDNGAAVDNALQVLERCMAQGLLLDGVVSQSLAQADALWRLRELISESLAPWVPCKGDLSVRVSQLPAFMAEVDNTLGRRYPEFELIWFGHLGDGNMHLNILKPAAMGVEAFQQRCIALMQCVGEIVQRYGGSLCAEHGVGLLKKDGLRYSQSQTEIQLMKQIKRVFDPQGILNPGKIFD